MQESIDNNDFMDDEVFDDTYVFSKLELINFLNRYKTSVLDHATVIDNDYNIEAPNFSTEEWLARDKEDLELPW